MAKLSRCWPLPRRCPGSRDSALHRAEIAGLGALSALWLAAALALPSCAGADVDSGSDATPGAAAGADAGADATGLPADPAACEGVCGGKLYVLDSLTLSAPGADGKAAGFDLDGETSTAKTPLGCGFSDLTGHGGQPGVDNQFAKVLKILPSQVASTLPDALMTSIRAGGLTVLLEEVGAPGMPTWAVVLREGKGKPLLATDGSMLPNQTFQLSDSPMLGHSTTLQTEGEFVVSAPFELQFRMIFVATPLAVVLHNAQIRLRSDGAGGLVGEVGGIISVADALVLVGAIGGCDQLLHDQLMEAVPAMADVQRTPGGACDGLSVGFGLHAVPAFVFDTH